VSRKPDRRPGTFAANTGSAARRSITDENAKLKKLLAEAMLDNAMLKDLNSKKR
jgi:hypothetical protein